MFEFVVLQAATPRCDFRVRVSKWMAGVKNSGCRVFPTASDAEKYARRSGIGATIWHGLVEGTQSLVAEIVAPSAHKTRPVTQVTWYGGQFL